MLNGLLNILTKDRFLIYLYLVMAISFVDVVFRLLRYPVIQLNDQQIEYVYFIGFPPKCIHIDDILETVSNGSSKFSVILKNNKKISLPINLIQKSVRDSVISEINEAIKR